MALHFAEDTNMTLLKKRPENGVIRKVDDDEEDDDELEKAAARKS